MGMGWEWDGMGIGWEWDGTGLPGLGVGMGNRDSVVNPAYADPRTQGAEGEGYLTLTKEGHTADPYTMGGLQGQGADYRIGGSRGGALDNHTYDNTMGAGGLQAGSCLYHITDRMLGAGGVSMRV